MISLRKTKTLTIKYSKFIFLNISKNKKQNFNTYSTKNQLNK